MTKVIVVLRECGVQGQVKKVDTLCSKWLLVRFLTNLKGTFIN